MSLARSDRLKGRRDKCGTCGGSRHVPSAQNVLAELAPYVLPPGDCLTPMEMVEGEEPVATGGPNDDVPDPSTLPKDTRAVVEIDSERNLVRWWLLARPGGDYA